MSDIDKVIELLRKKVDEAKLTYLEAESEKSYFVRCLKRKYGQGVYDGLSSAWCAVIRLKHELEAGK